MTRSNQKLRKIILDIKTTRSEHLNCLLVGVLQFPSSFPWKKEVNEPTKN